VNIRGDYEIGRSVRCCVCVCLSVRPSICVGPTQIHNRQAEWRPLWKLLHWRRYALWRAPSSYIIFYIDCFRHLTARCRYCYVRRFIKKWTPKLWTLSSAAYRPQSKCSIPYRPSLTYSNTDRRTDWQTDRQNELTSCHEIHMSAFFVSKDQWDCSIRFSLRRISRTGIHAPTYQRRRRARRNCTWLDALTLSGLSA